MSMQGALPKAARVGTGRKVGAGVDAGAGAGARAGARADANADAGIGDGVEVCARHLSTARTVRGEAWPMRSKPWGVKRPLA